MISDVDKEKWLLDHAFKCDHLGARISKTQCIVNQIKALEYRDMLSSDHTIVRVLPCINCPHKVRHKEVHRYTLGRNSKICAAYLIDPKLCECTDPDHMFYRQPFDKRMAWGARKYGTAQCRLNAERRRRRQKKK